MKGKEWNGRKSVFEISNFGPHMKNPDRKTVSRLVDLPNIGKAIASDLQSIGIDHPGKLIGKDPFVLYGELCRISGERHDPCVLDVFMSAVHFMEGGAPRPWWAFTDKRKKQMGQIKGP